MSFNLENEDTAKPHFCDFCTFWNEGVL